MEGVLNEKILNGTVIYMNIDFHGPSHFVSLIFASKPSYKGFLSWVLRGEVPFVSFPV